ncbi:MAG: protein kinase [Limnothrix sp.]
MKTSNNDCYCINPLCTARKNQYSFEQSNCKACETPLVVNSLLLRQPIYGFETIENCELFAVESLRKAEFSEPKILKILHPQQSKKAQELFRQEAQLLQRFTDLPVPKVASSPYFTIPLKRKIYGQRELHCIVMEQVQGQTLEKLILSEGIIPENIAVDWLRQLAQILLEVHRRGVLHRDIKPGNIMVRQRPNFPYGELILIDFGAARRISKSYVEKVISGKSQTKIISEGYTAPEQQRGLSHVQSDLFSLGKTLIFALTGNVPQTSVENLFVGRSPKLSPAFQDLITALVAEDYIHRIPNAQVLINRLEELLKEKSVFQKLLLFPLLKIRAKKTKAIATAVTVSFSLLSLFLRAPFANAITEVGDNTFVYKQEYQRAKKYYQIALFFSPQEFDARYGLAKSCEKLNDLVCAKKEYEKALSIQGLDDAITYRVYADFGRFLLLESKSESAIPLLEKALNGTKNPHETSIINRHLAAAYIDLREIDQAESSLNLALEYEPNNIKSLCLKDLIKIKKKAAINLEESIATCLHLTTDN